MSASGVEPTVPDPSVTAAVPEIVAAADPIALGGFGLLAAIAALFSRGSSRTPSV